MNKLNLEFSELPFAAEEALNRLRVNIKFCGNDIRTILFTSSIPNEGKSTITVELWKMLAEAGFKTLYIDADLRESVVLETHNVRIDDSIKGLDHYLSGQAEIEDVIYETNIENGYFIPNTTALENPVNLLQDSRLKTLLDSVSEGYRYIIIDSPPVTSVTDATVLATECDGVVLVVRSNFTSKKYVKQALQEIEHVNGNLLGVVLNRVPGLEKRKGKYYNKYYGKKKR